MRKRNKLAEDLATWIEKTGLKPYRVAGILGVGEGTVYNVMNGKAYTSTTEAKIRKVIDQAA